MMQVIDPEKQLPEDFPFSLIGEPHLIFEVAAKRIARAQLRNNAHTLARLVDLVYLYDVWMVYFF